MASTCDNVGISLTRYKLKEILSFVEKHSGACVGFQTQAHFTGVFPRYLKRIRFPLTLHVASVRSSAPL
jgi:hypothetical protein